MGRYFCTVEIPIEGVVICCLDPENFSLAFRVGCDVLGEAPLVLRGPFPLAAGACCYRAVDEWVGLIAWAS